MSLESEGSDGAVTLVTKVNGVEKRVACGKGTWLKKRAAWAQFPEQPAAASGSWTANDTFTAKFCFYETPFTLTVRLKFTGDEMCACELRIKPRTRFGEGQHARGESEVTWPRMPAKHQPSSVSAVGKDQDTYGYIDAHKLCH